MNRLAILLFIALLTFAIVFFIQRTDVFNEVWLWLIGLSGLIVQTIRSLFHFVRKGSSDPALGFVATGQSNTNIGQVTVAPAATIKQDTFDGITLTVLRYSDDGATTVGLLNLNGNFYCYTLEDTFYPEKIAGHTRIPAGEYEVDFYKTDTELTLKYRNSFSDWFVYHLEIKNVPGFKNVYIHSGGDHIHTKGCLLISDSLSVSADKTFLTNSRNTFKRLYTHLKEALDKGKKVRLIIRDERWFKNLTQQLWQKNP